MALLEKQERDPVGKALYVEFNKSLYTYQVIIAPPANGNNGEILSGAVITRRISTYHPRKKWSVSTLSVRTTRDTLTLDPYGEFEKVSDLETARRKVITLMSYAYQDSFTNLKNQGWEIIWKPLAVEVSLGEMQKIQKEAKLPISLYRRIERARINQGYPEELVKVEGV